MPGGFTLQAYTDLNTYIMTGKTDSDGRGRIRAVRLTDGQYLSLASDAAGYADAGLCTVSEDIGTDTFFVTFEIETEGYTEDGCFDGTGGHVTVSARCRVTEYSETLWTDDETEQPVDFDADRFGRTVERLLLT